MNSISAWNIFCQSMLANIDGETDYPELDYQFDQFLFCYSNNQRLYLEMAPSLTLYKLANGYEDKEVYGNHKRHEVYVVEVFLVVNTEQRARKQHYDVVNLGDETHTCPERTHSLVRFRASLDISVVVLFKLFLLVFGVGVRFGDSYAGNAVFERGVDISDFLSALSERL